MARFGIWDEFTSWSYATRLLERLGFERQGVDGEPEARSWRLNGMKVSLNVRFSLVESDRLAANRNHKAGGWRAAFWVEVARDVVDPEATEREVWMPTDGNLLGFKQALSEMLVEFDSVQENLELKPTPSVPRESEAMVDYARKVLEEGDFDVVSGTYAYFSSWHGGQSSWSYQALCVLGQGFNPGMGWSESNLDEYEIEAYNRAVDEFGGEPYESESE